MKTYIWTMVILMALECVGKAAMLKDGDLTRKPGMMLFDIALGVSFIAWGAYLLGSA